MSDERTGADGKPLIYTLEEVEAIRERHRRDVAELAGRCEGQQQIISDSRAGRKHDQAEIERLTAENKELTEKVSCALINGQTIAVSMSLALMDYRAQAERMQKAQDAR